MQTLLNDLLKLFSQAQLNQMLTSIDHDRVMQSDITLQLINTALSSQLNDVTLVENNRVNERLIQENPLQFILLTMVLEHDRAYLDTSLARTAAAEAYKQRYCTPNPSDKHDDRFELHYFYSRSVVPFMQHLLLMTGIDSNVTRYDGEMMGLFANNKKFYKGRILSNEMVQHVMSFENAKNKAFPASFKDALEAQADGSWRVIKDVMSPRLSASLEEHLDRLYMPARRRKQQQLVRGFDANLKAASDNLAPLFPDHLQNALVVIGPYGSGKTTYSEKTFGITEDKGLVMGLSADALNEFMKRDFALRCNRSDFHFESCVLKKLVDDSKINNIFATGAYIDERRFDEVLNKFFQTRHIQIVEVATPHPMDAIVRMAKRDNISDKSSSHFTSGVFTANNAQQFRQDRVKQILAHDNKRNAVSYSLVCNTQDQDGNRCFIAVCSIEANQLVIHDEALYAKLMDASALADLNEITQNTSFGQNRYALSGIVTAKGVDAENATVSALGLKK